MNDEELHDAKLDALVVGGLVTLTAALAVVGLLFLLNIG